MSRHLPGSGAIFVVLATLFLGSCAGTPSTTSASPGENPMLSPCPDAPHCVSSRADPESARHVAPFEYTTTPEIARALLLQAIRASTNATIESDTPTLVHATFRSTLGFVDDVHFEIHPDSGRIDVKSESRLGYYDFGVNRRRVEELRSRFNALQADG
jgi:uncharacterized protein (DUF1499 family)